MKIKILFVDNSRYYAMTNRSTVDFIWKENKPVMYTKKIEVIYVGTLMCIGQPMQLLYTFLTILKERVVLHWLTCTV